MIQSILWAIWGVLCIFMQAAAVIVMITLMTYILYICYQFWREVWCRIRGYFSKSATE